VPWDITIKRRDGTSLGSPAEVRVALERAFPGVTFYREPSGAEKLASLPAGLEVPDVIREHWASSPAQLQGDFERHGYSLHFYLGNEGADLLETAAIEARGASRPAMPLLEALTLATGWIIVDDWGNILVENGRTVPEAK
jgi:hypothetical protein